MALHDPEDPSIGQVLTRLIADAKEYGRAEVDYYKTLAAARKNDAVTGLIAGVAAAVLGLGLVCALLVGLILTLATLIGPGLATLAVVLLTAAVIALLARMAIDRFRHAFRAQPGSKR
ncbi:phage holin family protein [Sphingosinithalassobacter sp. CS137]|uniref:phage holin family protein n=1 Tax=Sphingosinithalassobacter sp. CS137 TaxID=2762748 RepID=UPI00165D45B6|nr:phage holin family protein [Sphingosinithalassobacter sp. CS137]